MAISDDRVKEIDEKIKEIDEKIIEVDNRIKMRLAGRLKADKIDDDVGINEVLVHHGMLLAAVSEKSALVTEKSALIIEKSSISVDKLSKSSERLENLTKFLIAVTVFLAGLTIILTFSEQLSYSDKLYLMILPFIAFIIPLYFFYRKRKDSYQTIILLYCL